MTAPFTGPEPDARVFVISVAAELSGQSYKGGTSMPVYWQGPSIGWDWGGNASKVFTLVYNLRRTGDLFQRFPAVDGSLYLVAGIGVNYQQSGNIVLAPMRTGVGLRAGASLGYVHYTREASVLPF